MTVKVKNSRLAQRHDDLTVGNLYRVIEVNNETFRVLSDDGRPYLYDGDIFDVVSSSVPDDWVVSHYGEGEDRYSIGSLLCFAESGFFESFFDDDPKAIATFEQRMARWSSEDDHLIADAGPRLDTPPDEELLHSLEDARSRVESIIVKTVDEEQYRLEWEARELLKVVERCMDIVSPLPIRKT